jgi:hypothetical protein
VKITNHEAPPYDFVYLPVTSLSWNQILFSAPCSQTLPNYVLFRARDHVSDRYKTTGIGLFYTAKCNKYIAVECNWTKLNSR